MKLLLCLAAFIVLTSCHTVHKTTSEVRKDSVSVSKSVTLSYVHKDSSYTKRESSQNVNEVVIEGDSISLVTYLPNYHEGDSVQVSNPVYRTWIDAGSYFPQIAG